MKPQTAVVKGFPYSLKGCLLLHRTTSYKNLRLITSCVLLQKNSCRDVKFWLVYSLSCGHERFGHSSTM